MSFKLTKTPSNKICIDFEVLSKMQPSSQINHLFSVPFERCFSAFNDDGMKKMAIFFLYSESSKRTLRLKESINEQVESRCKPFCDPNGLLVTTTNSGVVVTQVTIKKLSL